MRMITRWVGLKVMVEVVLVCSLLCGMFTLFPAPSSALSCMSIPEPKEALKTHEAVFTGEVIALREERTSTGRAKRIMELQVVSKWKGIQEERISLVYDTLSTFEQGTRYLIYAYQTTPDKYLFEYREGELANDWVLPMDRQNASVAALASANGAGGCGWQWLHLLLSLGFYLGVDYIEPPPSDNSPLYGVKSNNLIRRPDQVVFASLLEAVNSS